MHPVIETILSGGPAVTDGAWGTQLQSRGLKIGACPDAWNIAEPGRVEEVARSYVEAGSQIILTNTFGANRIVLSGHGLESQAAEINRRGVEISRRAAGERARVFASIGPTGKMLLMGEVTEDDLREAFREQAQALAQAGPDAIVIETMSDLAEAKIALDAALETGLAVVACMVFDSGSRKDRTLMGVTPEQAAAELTSAGAHVIGANCGQGVEGYLPVCRRLLDSTSLPIWVKANAGLPELVDGKAVYRTTPEEFARGAAALVEAGARFVGGCCGTGPEFIRALKEALSGG
ncbi:MAG: homocysteine S-methyltransferase family protein [Planctomycetes bacterium]|nr:homocysteine S-methyltransferase family protein [Planctomycetota bacterium]